MGLFIRQEDTRSELQKRLAAELTEKARQRTDPPSQPPPDGIDDSAYIENTQKTSKSLLVWILFIAVAVVIVVLYSLL